jgi:hypothetical protein
VATIHFREIMEILAARGETDALPHADGGFYLEIRFDDPSSRQTNPDESLRSRVIGADSAFGTVNIRFDDSGMLKYLEVS